MTDDQLSQKSLVATERVLEGMSSSLFVQTELKKSPNVRDLLLTERIGVVYTMNNQSKKYFNKDLLAAVGYTRDRAKDADILIDADAYSGKNRKPASAGIDPDWTRFQLRQAGLSYALTNSGYLAADDKSGLKKIMQQATKQEGNVIASLPANWRWLEAEADYLREKIEEHGRPVALMLEHTGDPLAAKGVAQGLAHVVSSEVPVLLLRSDMSALGGLAHGSPLVAVGTKSGYRHFYPFKKGGGGVPTPPSMLVPDLLGYFYVSKVQAAIPETPELQLWTCDCSFCLGKRLDWIGAVPTDADKKERAYQHSLPALATIGRQICEVSQNERVNEWVNLCQQAQARHDYVLTGNEDETWEPSPALRNWILTAERAVGL